MNIYKVEKTKKVYKVGVVEDGYCITKNRIPMGIINQWIDSVGVNSINTQRRYAYTLQGFLKYIDTLGMSYENIRNKVVIWNYMKKLIYEIKSSNVLSTKPQTSYNSVYHNINIITNFYLWLDEFKFGLIDLEKIKSYEDIDNKYLYAQIWGTKFFGRSKSQGTPFKIKFAQKRDSYRWYTEEDIHCFKTAFNTKRDLAIFLISVECGCRIEEILTIKMYDYDANERTVFISESKTVNRYCVVPEYLCQIINDYLLSERFSVEIENPNTSDEFLFINLKKGKSQGEKLTQGNYRKILKSVAKKVGLSPNKTITHAGRSTKVEELITNNASDTEIMDIMGWRSFSIIQSYRKQFSKTRSKAINDKIQKRRRKKD